MSDRRGRGQRRRLVGELPRYAGVRRGGRKIDGGEVESTVIARAGAEPTPIATIAPASVKPRMFTDVIPR